MPSEAPNFSEADDRYLAWGCVQLAIIYRGPDAWVQSADGCEVQLKDMLLAIENRMWENGEEIPGRRHRDG